MDPDTIPAVGRVPHGSSDDPDVLDFSENTNPRMPTGTRRVYDAALNAAQRYPPEPPHAYRTAAAAAVDCRPDTVIPTPGGLAAIRLAITCTVTPDNSILLPTPSFGEYAREAKLHGIDPSFVSHTTILDTDPAPHDLVVICNPNNPTGEAYNSAALRTFADRCRESDTTLLVDEAFLGFTTDPSLAGHDGVIVARSLTKLFGLPGLRAGYAVATGPQHRALHTARSPWNVSVPALRVGTHCLRQSAFVDTTRKRVRTERARLRDALSTEFDVYPSDAPFLLLRVNGDVDALVARARDHGVAIRDATTFRGLEDHVRVAVRLPDENDQLLEALGCDV